MSVANTHQSLHISGALTFSFPYKNSGLDKLIPFFMAARRKVKGSPNL